MKSIETAVLGGGCFWCLDAVFVRLRGLHAVIPGYMGGASDQPTYEAVCSGLTGHVEVVKVTFTPQLISFTDLLRIFFTIHDPTTYDRQGADAGSQYRSVIFGTSDDQVRSANELIVELDLDGLWDAPIVTEVRPAKTFYSAEKYHHHYYESNRSQPYCQYVIDPKVTELRNSWAKFLK
jgi:peptide-methionine (S)-S-oxide reductase